MIAEDALEQRDVGEPRHVVEHQGLVGEQRRDHQRQRRVLGAGNADIAGELLAADDANAIHEFSPPPDRPEPKLRDQAMRDRGCGLQ